MAAPLSLGVELVGDGIADSRNGIRHPAREIAALARRLESAGVDYWLIGAERGEADQAGRAALDPSLAATIAARAGTGLGLVVAAAGHRDHPYNLARRLISVDHAAGGRVGWLALDFDQSIALNAVSDTWTAARLDASHTRDVVAAVRTLGRTWPRDSVLGDHTTGVFTDVTHIRRANISAGYAIAGPLNVPGSVQGDLPVWRQADRTSSTAPDGADVVVVEDGDRPPGGVTAVVRIRAAETIDGALERISEDPAMSGVLLRLTVGVLDRVLDRSLPTFRRRGILGEPGSGTLRERLGLAARPAPDLSGHPAVFDSAPNPGGRL